MQEVIKLSSQSLALDQASRTIVSQDPHTKGWEENIESVINGKGINYYLIKDMRIAGISICIYAKMKMKNLIKNIDCSTVAAGVLGKIVRFLHISFLN